MFGETDTWNLNAKYLAHKIFERYIFGFPGWVGDSMLPPLNGWWWTPADEVNVTNSEPADEANGEQAEEAFNQMWPRGTRGVIFLSHLWSCCSTNCGRNSCSSCHCRALWTLHWCFTCSAAPLLVLLPCFCFCCLFLLHSARPTLHPPMSSASSLTQVRYVHFEQRTI